MLVFSIMNNNLGYVAIDLTKPSRQMLFDIVSKKIPEKDFFRSLDSGYTYINGNVCKKGHLTICYGIKNLDLKERFKTAKLKINWQKSIKIKNVQINLGYKEKYYVVVAIPEINQNIFLFNSWIRQNNELVSDALPFDPHIALCYLKKRNNEYPNEVLKYFQKKLIGKNLKLESLNYYLPLGKSKITLFKL